MFILSVKHISEILEYAYKFQASFSISFKHRLVKLVKNEVKVEVQFFFMNCFTCVVSSIGA